LTTNHMVHYENLMRRYRPTVSHLNQTASRNGHNCRLPRYHQVPVSLDPRTKARAKPGLVVHCQVCEALWQVRTRNTGYPDTDLVWSEMKPFTKFGANRAKNKAVGFNGDTAWEKPDPQSWDWDKGKPEAMNGETIWQMSYPEMCAAGENQCSKTWEMGHAEIGGPTKWTTYRCVLKDGHGGSHESPSEVNGMTGTR